MRPLTAGSSPLTRGKQRPMSLPRPFHGLIPAHAGKTIHGPGRSQDLQAHPRSRGENMYESAIARGPRGSSPLTRGKPGPKAPASTRRRLIPAHAGKTIMNTPAQKTSRAHPRSRGENSVHAATVAAILGSSPLTRGKHERGPLPIAVSGLIPAHAGKTLCLRTTSSSRRAHPRSRGENTQEQTPAPDHAGSSPLTRGKHGSAPSSDASERLIPAHAGKTCPARHTASWYSAHPRSRGENARKEEA